MTRMSLWTRPVEETFLRIVRKVPLRQIKGSFQDRWHMGGGPKNSGRRTNLNDGFRTPKSDAQPTLRNGEKRTFVIKRFRNRKGYLTDATGALGLPDGISERNLDLARRRLRRRVGNL